MLLDFVELFGLSRMSDVLSYSKNAILSDAKDVCIIFFPNVLEIFSLSLRSCMINVNVLEIFSLSLHSCMINVK